jgi:hypothetical protein
MLQGEKERLLALFADQRHWCQEAEARDEAGRAVHYDDSSASAWDITGGMCFLFGWHRALELFPQVDRHIHDDKRSRWWVTDHGIASMAALQDSNDDDHTTFEMVRAWLSSMPVWSEHRQPT